MRSGSPVTRTVSAPSRAEASAASKPAWPPPTTITAASPCHSVLIEGLWYHSVRALGATVPAGVLRRAATLLTDAEAGEDAVEQRLGRGGAGDLGQRGAGGQ